MRRWLVVVSLLFCMATAMAQAPKQRTLPPRDPKTGRFMKKSGSATHAMTAKGGKKGTASKTGKSGKAGGKRTLPPRDPKTGRFMKKK